MLWEGRYERPPAPCCRSQARRARYVPDRVSNSGDSRSLVAKWAKMPQIRLTVQEQHRKRLRTDR